MNPRIYASRAAKQAEYREAKKLGMTCAEYRAHIAAGGKPARYEPNRGWYGAGIHAGSRYNEKPTVTPPVEKCEHGIMRAACTFHPVTPPVRRKTHIVSPKPDCAKYVTACGKFQEYVKMTTDISLVTCSKCRTNLLAYKVTPPDAHIFTGNAVMTPLCLMRVGKRAKRCEQYVRTKGCPPTCKACLAAIAASIIPEDQPEVTPPEPRY